MHKGPTYKFWKDPSIKAITSHWAQTLKSLCPSSKPSEVQGAEPKVCSHPAASLDAARVGGGGEAMTASLMDYLGVNYLAYCVGLLSSFLFNKSSLLVLVTSARVTDSLGHIFTA